MMDMIYWIGGAVLLLALLGIIGKARRNQRLPFGKKAVKEAGTKVHGIDP